MKKPIKDVFVMIILISLSGSIFAASASCSAQNKNTSQFFSATGDGETQAIANQQAQNAVIQNCKQASSAPDGCEILSCSSSQ